MAEPAREEAASAYSLVVDTITGSEGGDQDGWEDELGHSSIG